jgi:hypothetical protein
LKDLDGQADILEVHSIVIKSGFQGLLEMGMSISDILNLSNNLLFEVYQELKSGNNNNLN